MGRIAHYLIVIYDLEQDLNPPVSTGRIAEEIDRSPPAVTEMIQRLEAKDLVKHEPYRGVELTSAGRERAHDLYESHQTLCRFFREILGLEEYEEEALELAGTVSPTVTNRLKTTVLPGKSLSLQQDDGESGN